MKKNNLLMLFVFLVLVFATKFNTINDPHHWDAMIYVVPASIQAIETNFSPYLDLGLGHPPAFYFILGLIFKIFGVSLQVAHIFNLVLAALTLFFTYLVGKRLYNPQVGIMASLFLLFTPLFFAQIGILHLDIALALFFTASIYFTLIDKKIPYLISSILLVLTKEPGIVLIAPILLYVSIKNFKNKKLLIKELFIYGMPVIAFFLWMFSNYLHYGWVLVPKGVETLIFSLTKAFLKFIIQLKWLLFDNYHWILLTIFLFPKKIKNLKIAIPLAIVFFFTVTYLTTLTYPQYFQNMNYYINYVSQIKYLLAVLFLFLVISFKDLIKENLNLKASLTFLPIITFILFFSLALTFPRYILPIYPLFFIITSGSAFRLLKNKSLILIPIMIVLFTLNYTGDSNSVGYSLETNLEYRDMIETHVEAAKFLETNYPNATILAGFPQYVELTTPSAGYVSKPLNVIGRIPSQSLFDLTKPVVEVNVSEADILYYSQQQFTSSLFDEAFRTLNMTLIKEFRKNGKLVYIYEVN